MKILHITAINTLQSRSGIPVVVRKLCEYQNQIDGIEARALSLRADAKEANSPFFDNLDGNSFCSYVRKYCPDIVIIHDFYYIQYIPIAICLKWYRIPFVIEPHGAFGKQAMKKSWLMKVIANNTIFRALIKGANGLIFLNDGEMMDSEYNNNRMVVIPNGVDKNDVEHTYAKSYNISSEPIFYFMGRFDINHKGLDYLFDALDILNAKKEPLTVRFYGVGSDKEMLYLHDRINKIKNINVEFRGAVFDEEKVKALRETNILLLTSRYEGFPMTILEALSFGNPCLVTPGTNVADEIESQKLGWKSELNGKAIADCILLAKNDYKRNYASYYVACRQYVLDKYQWSKIADQSIESYMKLVDRA